ncbi:MAG: DUF4138 domain-containing protein [Reichenbachiella sp.]|uniref:DUF4138 domain-containing protein n=2 Tax=Reichenbachiella sp. TaxID=2184521 RepID=UPI003264F871
MKKLITVLLVYFGLMAVVYGQASIVEVSYDKKVVLLFSENIDWMEVGEDQMDVTKEDKRAVLQVNDLDVIEGKVDFFETNLIVSTVDGSVYAFELEFNNTPKRVFHLIKNSDAVHNGVSTGSHGNKVEKEEKGADDYDFMFDKILKEDLVIDGDNTQGISMDFYGVYNSSKELFVRFRLRNETNIPYDIDVVSFFIDKKGSNNRKKSTSYKVPLIPIERNSNGEISRIDREDYVDYVFGFQKFRIDKDKIFLIEVHEHEGDGVLKIEVTPKDIENSLYVSRS